MDWGVIEMTCEMAPHQQPKFKVEVEVWFRCRHCSAFLSGAQRVAEHLLARHALPFAKTIASTVKDKDGQLLVVLTPKADHVETFSFSPVAVPVHRLGQPGPAPGANTIKTELTHEEEEDERSSPPPFFHHLEFDGVRPRARPLHDHEDTSMSSSSMSMSTSSASRSSMTKSKPGNSTSGSGTRPFSCPTCPSTFGKKGHLTRHLLTHAPLRPNPCHVPLCLKRFSTKYSLQQHLEKRHHISALPCTFPLCKKTFIVESELEKHVMMRHRGYREYRDPAPPRPRPPLPPPVKCSHCPKTFNEQYKLVRHERTHRPPLLHQCHHCQDQFPSKVSLRIHLQTHEDLCSEENKSKLSKTFSCDSPECGEKFFLEQSLTLHKESHEPKPSLDYKCSYCPRAFYRAFNFRRHERSHTHGRRKKKNKTLGLPTTTRKLESSFSCSECGPATRFPTRAKLSNHMSCHGSDNKCSVSGCGAGFKTSRGQLDHLKREHPQCVRYRCDLCSGLFNKASNFRAHYNASHAHVHGVLPPSLRECVNVNTQSGSSSRQEEPPTPIKSEPEPAFSVFSSSYVDMECAEPYGDWQEQDEHELEKQHQEYQDPRGCSWQGTRVSFEESEVKVEADAEQTADAVMGLPCYLDPLGDGDGDIDVNVAQSEKPKVKMEEIGLGIFRRSGT